MAPEASAAAPAPDTTPPTAAVEVDTTRTSIDARIATGPDLPLGPGEDATRAAKATIEMRQGTDVVAWSDGAGYTGRTPSSTRASPAAAPAPSGTR